MRNITLYSVPIAQHGEMHQKGINPCRNLELGIKYQNYVQTCLNMQACCKRGGALAPQFLADQLPYLNQGGDCATHIITCPPSFR